MNQITPPPKIDIIPGERTVLGSATLLAERLFRRLLSPDAATPLSAEQGAALLQGHAGDGDDGESPWHDQTMPIAERMKLAEGRPLRRRMMAAMAQQDCGQCGYNCHDYSEAIAGKTEARLNLCVPGGKETARMLKSLYEELDKAPRRSAQQHRQRRPPRLFPPPTSSPAVRATIQSPPPSCRDVCSTRADRKRKPGTSSSIFRLRPRLCRRRFLRHLCQERDRPCRPDHRLARRIPHYESQRQDVARGVDRGRFAVARAGQAV